MRLVLLVSTVVLGLALFASPATAQVTGVPGINDYTINGSISGSTSCNVVTIPAGGLITFNINGANPGSLAAIIVGASVPGSACFCTPGWLPLPLSSCVGVQSLDFPMFSAVCSTVIVVGTLDGAGNFTVVGGPCPPATRLATQAVVVDTGCTPTRVWSQAYDISCL